MELWSKVMETQFLRLGTLEPCILRVKWKTRSAECGVRSAECGVWKMRSVENAECGKCRVWKMRSVENAECGKCGVWKMWSVKEKYIKRL